MAKKKEQTFKFRSRSTFEVEAAISEHTATYVIGGQTITDKLEDFNAKFAPVDQMQRTREQHSESSDCCTKPP